MVHATRSHSGIRRPSMNPANGTAAMPTSAVSPPSGSVSMTATATVPATTPPSRSLGAAMRGLLASDRLDDSTRGRGPLDRGDGGSRDDAESVEGSSSRGGDSHYTRGSGVGGHTHIRPEARAPQPFGQRAVALFVEDGEETTKKSGVGLGSRQGVVLASCCLRRTAPDQSASQPRAFGGLPGGGLGGSAHQAGASL
jgi:hypothetical protein